MTMPAPALARSSLRSNSGMTTSSRVSRSRRQQHLEAGKSNVGGEPLRLRRFQRVENGIVEMEPIHRHDDRCVRFAQVDGRTKRGGSGGFAGSREDRQSPRSSEEYLPRGPASPEPDLRGWSAWLCAHWDIRYCRLYLPPCGGERIFLDLTFAKSLENPREGELQLKQIPSLVISST